MPLFYPRHPYHVEDPLEMKEVLTSSGQYYEDMVHPCPCSSETDFLEYGV